MCGFSPVNFVIFYKSKLHSFIIIIIIIITIIIIIITIITIIVIIIIIIIIIIKGFSNLDS